MSYIRGMSIDYFFGIIFFLFSAVLINRLVNIFWYVRLILYHDIPPRPVVSYDHHSDTAFNVMVKSARMSSMRTNRHFSRGDMIFLNKKHTLKPGWLTV